MDDNTRRLFDAKAKWHAAQRSLPPKEKVALVLKLQRQEVELNRARIAAGRPARPMIVWDVKP